MSSEVCGVSEKIRGYKGIGPEAGGYVPEDQALAYAMERCQIEKQIILETPGRSSAKC